jgi:hypothetical protein
MKLVDIWGIEENFWILNPQLKLAFKDVYDGDKSKGKESSSKLMWSVALFIDPKSKFKDLPEHSREDIIAKDYNKAFTVESTKHIIDKWKTFLSPAERQLLQLERIFNEREAYLASMKFNKENADELEKRFGATGKLFDELARLKDLIAEEESEGIVKGNAIESLSEKGEI